MGGWSPGRRVRVRGAGLVVRTEPGRVAGLAEVGQGGPLGAGGGAEGRAGRAGPPRAAGEAGAIKINLSLYGYLTYLMNGINSL